MSKIKQYDYLKPQPDSRDYTFSESDISATASTLSNNRKLPLFLLPVYRIENQSEIGLCTGVSSTNTFENLVYRLVGDFTFQASYLYNYTMSRSFDSQDLSEDNGATLRTAYGNMKMGGICRDVVWPFTHANVQLYPSARAIKEANLLSNMFVYFEVSRVRRVMKYIIGDLGFMIGIGFRVFPSFQSESVQKTGIIPMPNSSESEIGGHSCALYGFNDELQVYYVLNSYGKDWGNGGTGTIPYAYIESQDLTNEVKLMYPVDDFVQKYERFQEYVKSEDAKANGKEEDTSPEKDTGNQNEQQKKTQSWSEIVTTCKENWLFIVCVLLVLILLIIVIVCIVISFSSNSTRPRKAV